MFMIITYNTKTISTGSQACTACKYQRRKCAPDCILAPYFPHDRQKQFLNAHKLFGVSNITKIIKNLHPTEKDKAMKTIVFQFDMRAKYPVGGCYRIIQLLQQQIEYHMAELEFVLQQIAVCRAHQEAYQQQNIQISGDNDHDEKNINNNNNNNGDHTTRSYEILQDYNDHQSFQAILFQHDHMYVNAQQQQQDHDDDNGPSNVPTHHHEAQDFQYTWGLQDSMWIQSKGSCKEGLPLEGEDDRVGEVKPSILDQSDNLGHDYFEIATFEKGGFVKFEPQLSTEKRETMLNTDNVTLEGNEVAFKQHSITISGVQLHYVFANKLNDNVEIKRSTSQENKSHYLIFLR